jgi:hypothetical protein
MEALTLAEVAVLEALEGSLEAVAVVLGMISQAHLVREALASTQVAEAPLVNLVEHRETSHQQVKAEQVILQTALALMVAQVEAAVEESTVLELSARAAMVASLFTTKRGKQCLYLLLLMANK